jgi:hypothetical protein
MVAAGFEGTQTPTRIPAMMHRMSWRFLVLGDPTVEKFAVRDLDSRLSQRERMAVEEWENSAFPFRGMRDHPEHSVPLMGGMWGGDNRRIGLNVSKAIQAKLINVREIELFLGDDFMEFAGISNKKPGEFSHTCLKTCILNYL